MGRHAGTVCVRQAAGPPATDDGVTTPELVLEFRRPGIFNVIGIRGYLPAGQRVEAFGLDQ
jgi:hypothetical protein